MALISVIVPVYNVATYLPECLDSLCLQSLKDLEIILVDDGSTDASGTICDAYATKDARIQVLHQIKTGVSAARNRGMAASTAPLLTFVDSDDYLERDALALLYEALSKENADLALGNIVTTGGEVWQASGPQTDKVLLGRDNIMQNLLGPNYERLAVPVCNKLYKKELFVGLHFKEGKVCEDAFIFLDIFAKVNKIVYVAATIYHYRIRQNSIVHTSLNHTHYDAIESWQDNLSKLRLWNPAFIPLGEFRLWNAYRWVIDRYTLYGSVQENQKEIEELRSNIKRRLPTILVNKYMSNSRRIAFVLLCYLFPVYRWLKSKAFAEQIN